MSRRVLLHDSGSEELNETFFKFDQDLEFLMRCK